MPHQKPTISLVNGSYQQDNSTPIPGNGLVEMRRELQLMRESCIKALDAISEISVKSANSIEQIDLERLANAATSLRESIEPKYLPQAIPVAQAKTDWSAA